MQEGDAFAFRAPPWLRVDHDDSGGTASLQGIVEVVDGEAKVVNSSAALLDELGDRRSGGGGLEHLDERVTGGVARDARPVGVGERYLGQAEDVVQEWAKGGG